MFAAIRWPDGRREFWLECPLAAAPEASELPSSRAIEVELETTEHNCVRIVVSLTASPLQSEFSALVRDLAGHIGRTQDSHDAVATLLDRLHRWKRLLEGSPSGGLTAAERRGLFGELLVLGWLLENTEDSRVALAEGWTGPLGKHQDFQLGSVAIEVKTTAQKQPQAVLITSERELDETGLQYLFLGHVSLDERADGLGTTLEGLVSELIEQLREHGQALAVFEERLMTAGYLHNQGSRYSYTTYSVRDFGFFAVEPGFPRIVERQLDAGVGDVRYRVQLGAIQTFRLSEEVVRHRLGGAR
jgi:hypothetical protein